MNFLFLLNEVNTFGYIIEFNSAGYNPLIILQKKKIFSYLARIFQGKV